jgi:protoheme IX farnesyltransferase
MAIAWLYRRDYAQAGSQMLSVVDPSGMRAGVQAVLGASLLIPVSLIPSLTPDAGSPMVYALWSIALGGGLFAAAIRFALTRSDAAARPLLKASLIYLPAWLAMLVAVSV